MTPGEVWTQQVLAELRSARYRPLAWARFLARSFARAREARAERRSEHRRTLALGSLGLAAWAAVSPVQL